MIKKNNKINPIIANMDSIKQVNYSTIYKIIENNTPISRVAIAKISKLAPASVTKITRQLLKNGIIKETAIEASTGGRRAISLAPNSAHIYVIAIKIGRERLTVGCYNLSGEQLSNRRVSIELDNGDDLLKLLISEILLMTKEREILSQKISAISIALAGLINPKQGKVIYSSYYSLNDFPLAKRIKEYFNIPTYIGNYTRGLALAEHYFGASRDCLDSILISVHHGVGSGIIIQGKTLLGKNYNIGEIGHIQVNPAGKKCHCGNFGCLETEVSDHIIFEKVKNALESGVFTCITQETLSIRNIYDAAANNDPLCQKIVEDSAIYLGKIIAILVNLLSPEKIIISGKIIESKNSLFSKINQCVAHQTLPDFQNELIIAPTELPLNSTISAFSLIKQAIYEDDLLQKIHI